jgi:mannose-1-phosphate guanylyltransferase
LEIDYLRMKDYYAIIMAGGIGCRFWPLSRRNKPKQFLDILGTGETLLQQTFNRFKALCPEENIYVVTNTEHTRLVAEQLDINPERILSEPFRKNTAPCIAYATFRIMKENKNAVIAVSPADHIIGKQAVFEEVIRTGYAFSRSNEALITIGLIPDKPETGYGYIQADMKSPILGTRNLYKVDLFHEKPDPEQAKKFLKGGDFFWNSGIFIWSAESILKAFNEFLPEISSVFKSNLSLLGTPQEDDFIAQVYPSFKAVSIDYGIMEKARNVIVITADMGWSDLGTWSSLYAHSVSDENRNSTIMGNAHVFESSGNLISVTPGKKVLLQGLHDYIVVETGDALLVVRKQDEQNIKKYLEKIGNSNGEAS